MANQWVTDNVLPHIPPKPSLDIFSKEWRTRKAIADEILDFCDVEKYGIPEFWADYADYDWILFCQLFGEMSCLPSLYPRFCRDIRQKWDRLGCPKLPEQNASEQHNALADARWAKKVYEFLEAYDRNWIGRVIRSAKAVLEPVYATITEAIRNEKK
jgi:hypothetical protein